MQVEEQQQGSGGLTARLEGAAPTAESAAAADHDQHAYVKGPLLLAIVATCFSVTAAAFRQQQQQQKSRLLLVPRLACVGKTAVPPLS